MNTSEKCDQCVIQCQTEHQAERQRDRTIDSQSEVKFWLCMLDSQFIHFVLTKVDYLYYYHQLFQ